MTAEPAQKGGPTPPPSWPYSPSIYEDFARLAANVLMDRFGVVVFVEALNTGYGHMALLVELRKKQTYNGPREFWDLPVLVNGGAK